MPTPPEWHEAAKKYADNRELAKLTVDGGYMSEDMGTGWSQRSETVVVAESAEGRVAKPSPPLNVERLGEAIYQHWRTRGTGGEHCSDDCYEEIAAAYENMT